MRQPETIGMITVIAMVFIAIWISIGPFKISESQTAIGLSVIGIVLTILIFVFQLRLSNTQYDVLRKGVDYERMQKWYIRQYILERIKWLLEEFDQIEDQMEGWKNESNNSTMQSIREKAVGDNIQRIKYYLGEIISPANFANPLFPEAVKQNFRVIISDFGNGPAFARPQTILLANFNRAKFLIQATQQVVLAKKGPFGE